MHPASIDKLIAALKNLPGVGQRTAERYVYHWLKAGRKEVAELRDALAELLARVKSCELCWNFSDQNPCAMCANAQRDCAMLCVVSEPQDLAALEKTGDYRGRYFILRGRLDLGADENDWQKTKIPLLLERLRADKKIKELVLALNPDLPGETTMLFLEKQAKQINPRLKISRLARGLPMGSDLQYADEITLGSAIKNRR